ncbi:MAG: hypothetical protein AAF543_11195 [Pseudomonadota bacterium]
MKKPALLMVFSLLISFSSILPALAENEPPPRTPWQKAESATGQTVRWVVEGCAAYPVTVEAAVKAAGATPEPDIVADATRHPQTR